MFFLILINFFLIKIGVFFYFDNPDFTDFFVLNSGFTFDKL